MELPLVFKAVLQPKPTFRLWVIATVMVILFRTLGFCGFGMVVIGLKPETFKARKALQVQQALKVPQVRKVLLVLLVRKVHKVR
jgi:hypothetical protein